MPVRVLRDLRGAFGQVRDQGPRPTCLAFATSDAHAAARAGAFVPLSVEHLYWHAVRRTPGGHPADGVSLSAILDALDQDGQATEAGWPYLDTIPADLSAWAPPSSATPVFRHGAREHDRAAAHVLAALDADRPALVALRLDAGFFTPVDGVVRPSQPDDVAYHAVVAVAHGEDEVGAAHVLVRNSWGPGWGVDGHAWLPVGYVDARTIGLALMTEPRIA